MKKTTKILFILFSLFIFETKVYASSISIKSSSNSVNRGSSVTVTATVSADSGIYTVSGSVYCNGAGVSNGIELNYEDLNTANKTLSRNVKLAPTTSGTIICKTQNVKIRELAKDGEYSLNDNSITITVTNNNSSGGTGTTNETKKEIKEKSSDNTLSSLSVEGYDLSPKFSKDTLEYKLEVDESIEKINIKATSNSDKAEVKGTGEKQLTLGENKIEVKVIAENGNEKIYKIIVTVKDQHPINITIGNKKYTIVKKNNDVIKKIDYYDEEKIKIDNQDVISYINKKTQTRLVILKDSDNNLAYYVYNDKEKTYEKYNYITMGNITLQILNYNKKIDNYSKYKIKINDQDIYIYKKSKDNDFGLIYGINIVSGNKGFYQYDEKEQTLARYNKEKANIYIKEDKNNIYLMIAVGCLSLILIVVISISLIRSKKERKKVRR